MPETKPKITPESIPTAAVIIIGNEILSGRTQDQNVHHLANKLNSLGIRLNHVHVIGDIEQTIIETTLACAKSHTYVFTTGGIGPTHDDITAEAMAKAFKTTLHYHPEAVAILQEHYGDKINDTRMRMALIPKGAGLISNPSSAAPGFYCENVFVMAGVPEIMQAMFDEIAGLLVPGPKIYSQTVQTLLAESLLAEGLSAIQAQNTQVDIGSYPYFKNGSYGVSLVLRGLDQALVGAATDEVVRLVEAKGGTALSS